MNITFAALKCRLASKVVGGALVLERPIFGVELQLRMPDVVLHPSLDEIQEAINATAKNILHSTKQLRKWGGEGASPDATLYDLISEDPHIVKAVLLLAGSIDGMRQQAAEYMSEYGVGVLKPCSASLSSAAHWLQLWQL